MASADGSYAFNTTLSRNRANSAKNWLVDQLHISASQASRFSVGSRPEGWMPVLQAMIADGHPDSLKVREILDKYNAENDDVAERYIRRLSCWNDIKNNYLQKDRQGRIRIYIYTEEFHYRCRTARHVRQASRCLQRRRAAARIDPEEDSRREEGGIPYHLHYFPQSQVAANNLAVLLLREDKADEAEAVLNGLKEYSPEVLNTKQPYMYIRKTTKKLLSCFRPIPNCLRRATTWHAQGTGKKAARGVHADAGVRRRECGGCIAQCWRYTACCFHYGSLRRPHSAGRIRTCAGGCTYAERGERGSSPSGTCAARQPIEGTNANRAGFPSLPYYTGISSIDRRKRL